MGLVDLTVAIASQLEQALTPQVDVIQVTATANRNPTPPALDVYPDDPFEEPDTYGIGTSGRSSSSGPASPTSTTTPGRRCCST